MFYLEVKSISGIKIVHFNNVLLKENPNVLETHLKRNKEEEKIINYHKYNDK